MKKFLPTILIGVIILIIAAVNYVPGTILTGGDNLHPEFNLSLNIRRSIFSVWQEYQGLGLLGGMGHATDLTRQLFLLPFTLVIPQNVIRYAWTIFTLFIGTLGSFYLISKIISELKPKVSFLIPFTGALFYLLNLSTLQSYYTPYEAFSAHFAALPWLLLVTINFFEKQSLKNTFLLALVLLLATPMSYVPTLFIVYLLAATFISIAILNIRKNVSHAFKTYLKFLFIVFIINAFWLVPFAQFTLFHSSVNVDSKINQMVTETIVLQNKEFGGIEDVMLLKGFWFNNVEPDIQGKSTYMLKPWRDHLSNPFILAIGYALFAIVFSGLIFALRSKKPIFYGLGALFLFCIVMLASTTFPFSFTQEVLRNFVPLFNQVFRFAFTKFSIITSLLFAIFFAITVLRIEERFSKIRNITVITPVIATFLLFIFMFPIFRGNLFYFRQSLEIPKEYQELFTFFDSQDPNSRIANLPQYKFWGWDFYDWNYSGSGFLWYGLKQPILDRAFDVWSKNSENYYFELTNAIYSKNEKQLNDVLKKYQVGWVIIDRNIISPHSPKALYIDETRDTLVRNPNIKWVKDFGDIEVYKVSFGSSAYPKGSSAYKVEGNKIQDFLFTTNILPNTNTYSWSDNDVNFSENGNYASDKNKNLDIFYPFNSLFSKKSQKEIEYNIKETKNDIELTSTIPNLKDSYEVKIPEYVATENFIPVVIETVRQNDGMLVKATIKSPKILVGNEKIYGQDININLFVIPKNASYPLALNVNGAKEYQIKNEEKVIDTTFFTPDQFNFIVLNDKKAGITQTQIIDPKNISNLPIFKGTLKRTAFIFKGQTVVIGKEKSGKTLKIIIPKITDNYLNHTLSPKTQNIKVENCDYIRKGDIKSEVKTIDKQKVLDLFSNNTTACISSYAPKLFHDNGYALFINAKNIQGKSLHFWILNEDQKYAPIDTYIKDSREYSTSTFIVPPMEKYGQAYSLHLDNISIAKSPVENSFASLSVYPIPYDFIRSIKLKNMKEKPDNTVVFKSSHPNTSLYTVNNLRVKNKNPFTLVLSQSYDDGWKAYKVNHTSSRIKNTLNSLLPFVFGKRIDNHILVNNWENGWVIDPSDFAQDKGEPQIVLIYLPQYFEYVGFALIACFFIVLAIVEVESLGKLKKNHYSSKLVSEAI